jgi:hypothetical protein
VLAQACYERWEHETGNAQLKTYLCGPGKVLRSQPRDVVRVLGQRAANSSPALPQAG